MCERAGYVECGAFGGYRPDPLSVFMEKRLDDAGGFRSRTPRQFHPARVDDRPARLLPRPSPVVQRVERHGRADGLAPGQSLKLRGVGLVVNAALERAIRTESAEALIHWWFRRTSWMRAPISWPRAINLPWEDTGRAFEHGTFYKAFPLSHRLNLPIQNTLTMSSWCSVYRFPVYV